MDEKTCIRCGATKCIDEFSLSKGKPINTCRTCKTAITAEWRIKNAQRFADRCAAYAQKHAARLAKKTAAYRKANPERAKVAKRKCYEKRREYYRQKNKAWQEAHANDLGFQESMRARVRNRRARLKGIPGWHTAADVLQLYAKQKGKCANCKRSIREGYHVDHIIPTTKPGCTNWPDNLQLLCRRCNQRKSDKHPDDWATENGRLF